MVVDIRQSGLDSEGNLIGGGLNVSRGGEIPGLRKDLANRVKAVTDNMEGSPRYREAAPAAEGGHGEGGHGGHGGGHAKPAKANPLGSVEVDWADLKAGLVSGKKWIRASRRGEIDQGLLAETLDDVLDGIPLPKELKSLTNGIRYTLPVLVPILGMLFHIPEHAIGKTTPNYSALGDQIMGLHADDDDPNSYHHGMVALLSGLNEVELQSNYSCFNQNANFTKAMSTAKGRKVLNEEFTSLFGKKIETRAQFLVKSRQMLTRMGATFTTNAPDSPIAHMHPLREVHAGHSLHALQEIIVNARTWITDDNIGKIAEPGEEVKLDKNMNKFGDTLMEHVKGSADLSQQFLGNINMNVFNKTFRLLLDDTALEIALSEEPEEVKKQLYELFNLSGHVNAAEVISFAEGLIGPAPYPPDPAASPAVVPPATMPAIDVVGGALGNRNAVATDNDTRTKYDQLRRSINEVRVRLTTAPVVGDPTPLEQLFPPKTEVLDYAKFGQQLGKAVRNKNGSNRMRARAAVLRGLDVPAFDDHFLILTDNTALTAAAGGSKADKDRVKARLTELTGVDAGLTQGIFRRKMADIRRALADGGAPDILDPRTQADLIAKRAAFLTVLGDAVTPGTLQHNVEAVLDQLYQEESVERNLGTVVLGASTANLESVISKINTGMLVINYGQLNAQFTTPPGVFPNPVAYKEQLARFIGANASFTWNDANVGVLLDELDRQADNADTLFRSRVTSNKDALKNMVARIRTFVGTTYPGSTAPTFFEHLQTL